MGRGEARGSIKVYKGVLGKDVFLPGGARKKNSLLSTQIAFVMVKVSSLRTAFVANPLLDQIYSFFSHV